MHRNLLNIIAIFCFVFATQSRAEGNKEIIHLSLTYKNESCLAFFWTGKGDNRHKIEYKAKAKTYNKKQYCLIQIPVSEFNSHFSLCSLSGLSNISQPSKAAEPDYVVTFAGGPHHPKNVYFFEWKDARNIFPRYACIAN